ncbi:hypothetical protein MSAN_01120900 [Mycena sanguinolenta]|uniref:Transmembrane protein n=1 Tax=Mycena sanguinolenta TaxID=230812 RepID=A0A8H7D492_9AGAR|nr:hypothetical protein MSAN_01120900 [Mycena sanguinolenta]
MAELSNPVKAFLKVFIIFCIVVTLSNVPAVLIEKYCPTAPWAPVTKAVFVWITDTGSHALAGWMFCVAIAMLGMLVTDSYKGLSRTLSASPVGPIALEDGITVPAAAPTEEATQPSLTLGSKLLLLFVSTSFCLQRFFMDDVISVEQPLWLNIGVALLYILRGLQILQLLFGAFLVVMSVTWLRKRRSVGRSTAPARVPEMNEKVVVGEGNPEKIEV